MVCSHGKQSTSLEVAPFNGSALGAPHVLVDGRLYASPAWSPDGKALAYFAPQGQAGHFQLWWLPLPVNPPPSPTAASSPSTSASARASASVAPAPTPVQATEGVDLSATSPPAWY